MKAMNSSNKREAVMKAAYLEYEPDEESSTIRDTHVIPVGVDVPEHESSSDCWCEPEIVADFIDDGGCLVWLHREVH